jgi:hypothetical protein
MVSSAHENRPRALQFRTRTSACGLERAASGGAFLDRRRPRRHARPEAARSKMGDRQHVYPRVFKLNPLKTHTLTEIYPTELRRPDNAAHANTETPSHQTSPPEARPLGARDADVDRVCVCRKSDQLAPRASARRHFARLGHTHGDAPCLIRAGELARLRRRRPTFFKRGRDLRRRHLLRSVIGSRLRRKLKHKDLATRIAILIAALRDLDSIARPLAQRMRRGLARLWAITAKPMLAGIMLGAPAPSPALADSS